MRSRANQRHAASDWMAMEQDRGISITASALEMEYAGYRINLLDTPGHQDFSEDTYRTLMAVDSAVMVLDAANGIEPQTLKLFQVCKMRHIPILTFINKMDRDGKEPLELLDEIESVLQIAPVPMNWPVGSGPWFQGVYDFERNEVLRFERTEHNETRGADQRHRPGRPGPRRSHRRRGVAGAARAGGAPRRRRQRVRPRALRSRRGDAGVLRQRPEQLRRRALPRGAAEAGAAAGRAAPMGSIRSSDVFSGFVFKIQANMDMKHRDRIAFVRVCSGRFERDMVVNHARLGKKVRLGRAYKLFARERQPIDEALPGRCDRRRQPGHVRPRRHADDGWRPAVRSRYRASLRSTSPRWSTRTSPATSSSSAASASSKRRARCRYSTTHRACGASPSWASSASCSSTSSCRACRTSTASRPVSSERPTSARAGWSRTTGKDRAPLLRGMLACVDRNEKPVYLFSSKWELDYFQGQNPDVVLAEIQ